MHVGSTYISWWPGGQGRDYTFGSSVPIYSVPHIVGQTFADDQALEGEGGPPRAPDHSISLDGLDEGKILDWWKIFSRAGNAWKTLGQNCSTTVGRGLMVGSGDDYAEGLSGWWHSWNMVWQPADVLRYAQAIERGLNNRSGRHFAINFIRRFTKSPMAITSMTYIMDEDAMAQALFKELGVDMKRVEQVFKELDEHRNSDADDVAEAYVNLIMKKGGIPQESLRRAGSLKQRLIKILKQGWTSAGEKRCIEYLQSLN